MVPRWTARWLSFELVAKVVDCKACLDHPGALHAAIAGAWYVLDFRTSAAADLIPEACCDTEVHKVPIKRRVEPIIAQLFETR